MEIDTVRDADLLRDPGIDPTAGHQAAGWPCADHASAPRSSLLQKVSMAAHAGERAQKTGDFYCAHWSEKVHVKQGDEVPSCPKGHKTFETRRHEPGNKS